MAKATRKELPPVDPPVEITLTLNKDEARILERYIYTGRWPAGRSGRSGRSGQGVDEKQPPGAPTTLNVIWAALNRTLDAGESIR